MSTQSFVLYVDPWSRLGCDAKRTNLRGYVMGVRGIICAWISELCSSLIPPFSRGRIACLCAFYACRVGLVGVLSIGCVRVMHLHGKFCVLVSPLCNVPHVV